MANEEMSRRAKLVGKAFAILGIVILTIALVLPGLQIVRDAQGQLSPQYVARGDIAAAVLTFIFMAYMSWVQDKTSQIILWVFATMVVWFGCMLALNGELPGGLAVIAFAAAVWIVGQLIAWVVSGRDKPVL